MKRISILLALGLAAQSLCGQALSNPAQPINVAQVTVSTAWLYQNKIHYAGAWYSSTVYNNQDLVIYAGGSYISLQLANLGHQPDISGSWWVALPGSGGGGGGTWGSITGTLTNQTDLNSALSGKQATLSAYATISGLSGYPSTFPPVNSGDWAGTWGTHAASYFQTAISGAPSSWPTLGTAASHAAGDFQAAGSYAVSTGLTNCSVVKYSTTGPTWGCATAGTDYAAATSGSAPLKGNGAGGFSAAGYSDIVGLWTACTSGYLKHDGSCDTPSSGGVNWDAIGNPGGNLSLTMAARTSTFTHSATTGSGNMWTWTDTTNNTGTGYMHYINLASGSAMKPWFAAVNGNGVAVSNAGLFAKVGTGSVQADSLSAQYVDWGAASGGASIANKPSLGTAASHASTDFQTAISGAPGTWPSFGAAALLNVGAATGTVAAGDDSRFVAAGETPMATDTAVLAAQLTAAALPATPVSIAATTHTMVAPREYFLCSTATACSVTLPVPAAGYEFCIRSDNNVSTAITLAAQANILYEKTDRTGWGTAGNSISSAAAVSNQICVIGYDATHYAIMSSSGTWTNN